MKKTIEDLNNQIRNEKNTNSILNEKNKVLTEKLKEKNKKIDYLINENKKLNELIKEKQMLIENQSRNAINNDSDKKIIKLYDNLEELKLKLSRYPYDLSEGEELISVIFTSTDQKIHQSIICKNTEKFSRLEEILYKAHPEYSDSDNYFCVNGKVISRFRTLKENNIKNSDIIILNIREL